MDAGRFDQIVRRWTETGSRRPLLGAIAASVAALTGVPDLSAKHKKKKKVTLCLNGQTITVPKKKQGSYLGQGATVGACSGGGGNGPCTSDAACNRCARETCQAGVCACPAGMIRDTNGVCGAPPVSCAAVGQTVSLTDQCCSRKGNPLPGGFFCIPGSAQCARNQDCSGGGKCLGGLCPPLYLSTVGQACKAGIGCTSPNDCGDKACRDGVCVSCETTGQCGADQFGQCTCESGVCASSHAGTRFFNGTCESSCPPGTARCAPDGTSNGCFPACGKTFACCTKPGDICGGSLCS